MSPLANDPHSWAEVSREFKYLELEIMHTAVMRLSGVPWETLAARQGVPRQAIHRRLAKKVEHQIRLALDNREQKRIGGLVDDILAMSSKIKTHVEEDSSDAAYKVVERSTTHRWWELPSRPATRRRGDRLGPGLNG